MSTNTDNLPHHISRPFKAIETEYRGFRFRSRLEARWAVFFDALGIEFLYEPEGFNFGDSRYLPDFYLPHVQMWAEVKPEEFSDWELGIAAKLADATQRHVLLLVGVPDTSVYQVMAPACPESGCRWNWEVIVDPFWGGKRYYEKERRFYGNPGGGELFELSRQYTEAVLAARGARFGEGGRW